MDKEIKPNLNQFMKRNSFFIALLFTVLSCGKDSSSDTSSSGGSTTGRGGSLARFAATNTHLYTLSTSDLTTYDISTSTNPVFQTKFQLGFDVETIFPKEKNLFIGTQTGMRIMDISNPDAPKQISNFSHIRSCDPVVANEKYAFITLRQGNACTRGINELQIIDISNLSAPKLINAVPMNNPIGIALDGNNLFVCDGGIKHYDISNIMNLTLKGKTVIDATDLIANNGILIAIGSSGLYQYDYTSGSLKHLSTLPVKQ